MAPTCTLEVHKRDDPARRSGTTRASALQMTKWEMLLPMSFHEPSTRTSQKKCSAHQSQAAAVSRYTPASGVRVILRRRCHGGVRGAGETAHSGPARAARRGARERHAPGEGGERRRDQEEGDELLDDEEHAHEVGRKHGGEAVAGRDLERPKRGDVARAEEGDEQQLQEEERRADVGGLPAFNVDEWVGKQ